jgi:hypothetical protein
MLTKIAFVLGNGTGRQGLDLDELSRLGPVYGCNALFRDFTPELLVATDAPIAREIENSGYPLTGRFVTRNPRRELGSKKIEHNFTWSSGPIALKYACVEGATEIFLLGFDLSGKSGKFNNIYADTQFYKKSSDSETYSGNWISQIASVITEYLHIKFIRVIGSDSAIPDQFLRLKNLRHIGIFDLRDYFSTIK